MASIFWGSGMMKSCADAAPGAMQAMMIARADFHIHALPFQQIENLDMAAVTRIAGV
jgi:hypothetical protein